MTVAIKPGTPEHARIISASKVSAIMGVSPWMSRRALWHIMRGDVAADVATGPRDHLDMGHDLEPAIANMWRRRNRGWRLSPGERQYRSGELSFPHVATLDRIASRGRWRKGVELKSAREDDHWGEPGTDQIPDPYLVQVMFQMLVSGLRWIDVVVLFAWFDVRVYRIPFDLPLAAGIASACAQFYQSLNGDEPPPLDDTDSTLAVLKRLHGDIDPGAVQPVPVELGLEFLDACAALDAAKARENHARARVLELAGTAQYVESNGVRIGRRQRSKTGPALHRVDADRAALLTSAGWKGTE